MQPDAIGHHAGSQRMIVARDPASQFGTAAAGCDLDRLRARQDLRHAAFHRLAQSAIFAADMDLRVPETGMLGARYASLPRGQGHRSGLQLCLQSLGLGRELIATSLGFAIEHQHRVVSQQPAG